MKDTITITRKGQTTLPVEYRRKLGVDEGGSLQVTFDAEKNQLIISKPKTLDEITEIARRYLKPGIKPLENVDEYYQKHRNVT